MEAKKKEHLKLEKQSGLYFAIGIALILGLVYTALEWKTFNTEPVYLGQLSQPDDLPDEQAPFIKPPEPPKPKPLQSPPIIKIIDDTSDKDDTLFDIPEPDADLAIPEVSDIPDFVEEPIDEEIIFINVEEKPIFPGCEGASDKYACFQERMLKHIKKNFRYPESAIEMGQQGRVTVVFTIQKDGSIGNVRMRSPYQVLESEAARIISKLPKMQPGKQRGKAVKVPFSIPITFKLQ